MLVNCTSNDDFDCYDNLYKNVTNYSYNIETYTPDGIPVVTNNYKINLYKIDAMINQVELCLEMYLKRDCFSVVIPHDVYISPCSGQQLFPCDIDPIHCEEKGIIPTEQCPCNCRATIQDENIIITTPNLLLFKAELIRMMTGINNIWDRKELVRCIN